MTTRVVDIEAAVHDTRSSPSDHGTVDRIAIRPADGERRVVDQVEVDKNRGLVGDNWLERVDGNQETSRHNQVTLMNSRFANAITPEGHGWELAGDQLYVDFDISVDNAPTGTLLQVGSATVRISAEPHTGCAKFSKRFGRDILRATQTDEGKQIRLRGVNASVVESGSVSTGDSINRVGLDD